MVEALYKELADWAHLLSPPHAYADEAANVMRWMEAAAGPVHRVLELGSCAGQLCSQLPSEWEIELLDRSPAMLEMSRKINPDRVHHAQDMRSFELSGRFDAILLHDAVMYLQSPDELSQTFAQSFKHLRPGGALIVMPDFVAEEFEEHSIGAAATEGDRAIQLMEWHWDPDPADQQVRVDFAIMLRDGKELRCVHDPHTMGSFSRQLWWDRLREAGFLPVEVPVDCLREEGELFLCRRSQ